ncbi:HAD family hydrolase [Kitasatospora sp. NPDC088391]|uniref:HAD family hydrolase n=1 Tax=Kitasatospora sp. NPDC088391 TaxID=3364074 RepID=UPI00381043B4
MTRRRPAGLIVDLDDTLYPQAEFLAAAWDAVADAGAELGQDRAALRAALDRICAEGSDRGRIVDRALAALGCHEPGTARQLVDVFRAFRPRTLTPYPGVAEQLARLAESVPVVVLTDGNPEQQRAKLAATGLAPLVSHLVCTDALPGGRSARKPAPDGFRHALALLGCRPVDAFVLGDRPDKDVLGAARLGIPVFRVRQGEYRELPDLPEALTARELTAVRGVDRTPDALALLLAHVEGFAASRAEEERP